MVDLGFLKGGFFSAEECQPEVESKKYIYNVIKYLDVTILLGSLCSIRIDSSRLTT